MADELGDRSFYWIIKFVHVLTAGGLKASTAKRVMANPTALRAWIASAKELVVAIEAAEREAYAMHNALLAKERAELVAQLATQPLEVLCNLKQGSEFYMAVRVYSCLKAAGIHTVGQIPSLDEMPRHLRVGWALDYLRRLLDAAKLSAPAWLREGESPS